jgi:acetoacetate decarboxylase
MLRDRLKAVEARKVTAAVVDYEQIMSMIPAPVAGKDAVVNYEQIRLMIPDPIKGEDAVVDYVKIKAMIPAPIAGKDAVVDYEKIRLMIPDPVAGEDGVVDYVKIKAMIPAPIAGKDAVVDYEKIRDMIPPPKTPKDGEDGDGIASAKVDTRGHLIVTLDSGRIIDAGRVKGKDAQSYQGMIAGGPSTPRPSGIVTLDFGASNKTATAVVTGVGSISATSVVLVKMRIEDTADHIAEDLLVDPIRVEAFAIVPGVGFTIYGTMQNAPANGKYNVQWALV